MTTDTRATMQAALEALEYRLSGDPDPHIPEARAIELLRTALAATPADEVHKLRLENRELRSTIAGFPALCTELQDRVTMLEQQLAAQPKGDV